MVQLFDLFFNQKRGVVSASYHHRRIVIYVRCCNAIPGTLLSNLVNIRQIIKVKAKLLVSP